MTDKPIVEVVWDDAHVSTGGTTLKKAEDIVPIRTRTVGYLMSDNEEGIVLASDIYPEEKKEGAIINFIPHGMVVEWSDLE